MFPFRIQTIFRYSTLRLVGTGLILLALLCHQGCTNKSKEKRASSAKKSALIGKPAQHRPKPVHPKSNLPPPTDEVVVRVIDPGKDPLKQLRYKFRAGDRYTAQVIVNEKITANVNGEQFPERESPPLSFKLTTSVDSTIKGGPSKLRLQFERSSSSNASADARPSIVAKMLGSLYGVPGIRTVTDKGEVRSTHIEIPDGANPAIRKLWQGTQRIVESLIRFPEQPIGIGGQWEIIQDVDLVTRERQTTKYELVALDRKGGAVQVEINQIGRPGIVAEMSNKNVENYLDVFKATGKARFEFKFDTGVNIGEITTITDATYTAESDLEDRTSKYHTVHTVKMKRATSSRKAKKKRPVSG